MPNIIHNENKIIIPFLGFIFIIAIFIISFQRFLKLDFGFLGFIAWIIVILGAIYFVLWVLSEIFGW